ncbi:hypothetical protein BJY01DRAFT_247644 [Aspergillus pseudoustus]|uniref:Major facilitator superfamily domain-containing protein n=1 Tax=Aspergillus pseudoustus TaxID=1810923 RepID=A0ABR4K110_9EURO
MGLLPMLPTAGPYAFAFFTPTILGTFGYSTALSQILTTPPYLFSAIVSIAAAVVADRMRIRSPFIIGHSLLDIAGLVLVGWGNNTDAQLTGSFIAVTGTNCAIPSALAFLSNNVASTAK